MADGHRITIGGGGGSYFDAGYPTAVFPALPETARPEPAPATLSGRVAAFTAHLMPWWQFVLPLAAIIWIASATWGR